MSMELQKNRLRHTISMPITIIVLLPNFTFNSSSYIVESFKLAAAAIMDASSSFSARQSVLSTGQDYDMPLEYVSGGKRGKKVNRKHTINKTEIDSTPKSVTKFDKPYLER